MKSAGKTQRIKSFLRGYPLTGVPLPRVLILDLTSRCNLRCFMCNVHMECERNRERVFFDMSDDVFSRCEPLLASARVINLGGCGEPLISKNFEQRVRRIRELNPEVYLLTFTNGLAIHSREIAARYLPLFNEIHLSLNGVDSYDSVMTGSRFEKIRRNMEYMREVRRETGKPENLVMGFIVMRRNLADIVPAAHLAREMNFSRIQFKNLWVFNDELRSESIHHHPELAAEARAEIEKVSRSGFPVECEMWPELNANLSGIGWGADLENEQRQTTGPGRPPLLVRATRMLISDRRLFKERLKRFTAAYYQRLFNPDRPGCDYPWRQVQVFENGDIFLCCLGETKVGNLTEQSFTEIWDGPEVQRYRSGMLRREYYRDCATCKLLVPEDPSAFEKKD
jgi:radical SAM protein with 4Fe4S-binding SPASM domain